MATNSSIAYRGEICVKVKNYNKVIYKKTFHNSGNLPLFKFICYCLAGNFNTVAMNLIPMKIRLYYNPNTVTEALNDIETGTHEMSSVISVNTTASITQNKTANTCTTTLHFLVPYSLLRIDDEYCYINEVALFPAEATESDAKISDESKNYSAKYLMIKNTAKSGTPVYEWDPIDLTDYKESYNIIIE